MADSIQDLIGKSMLAQQAFEAFSQADIDTIVQAIGKAVYDNAQELAELAVSETGLGNYEDKLQKNLGKSKGIWNYLKGIKSRGVISPKDADGIMLVAKPVGVVGAVTPTTNPTVTPMCNAMYALKGGNAIIVAPHPRAQKTTLKTVELMNAAIKKLAGPDNLIQCITNPTIELTNELMQSVDVLVATGGPAMIKAAYSSGKPALGVGPGNVQVIIDRGVDYHEAASQIVAGRKFDNGIICSGENGLIVPVDELSDIVAAFKKAGAYYVEDQAEVERYRKVIFSDGMLTKEAVGQLPQAIAELAGLSIPEDTKIILLKSDGADDDVLRHEVMCPVLALFAYEDFQDAIAIAQHNLEIEGKGHSCAIHSNDQSHIEAAGIALPVSRLIVNAASSLSAGGNPKNGFIPTTTLGCGSWGNNSISENLNYKHFINIQRVGYVVADKVVPTDDEVWAD